MDIYLHDADKTNFPNLALMKISAYHKKKGDNVQWFDPLFYTGGTVYSSKVFSFTDECGYLPDGTIKGGIGYGLYNSLEDEIEHIMPDYSICKMDYSLGFLTRGCPRKCEWCFVPKKEGEIRANADIEEFLAHKNVVIMDNNILACSHGIDQIRKISDLGVKVDFNQGLDARLIDDTISKILSRVKFLSPVRLACDHKSQIPSILRAVESLRWHNVTPRNYFCYVLVKDIEDAKDRVRFLKGIGVDPFCQPFRDDKGTEPTQEQKAFSRWVNHKAEFKSRTWEEYKMAHNI